jgi:hypothetical protein
LLLFEKLKEQNEMRECTFKPEIHAVPENTTKPPIAMYGGIPSSFIIQPDLVS